ncbi:MAG: alpha/beta fold hydrolase [Acetobacteraceae bacterium]
MANALVWGLLAVGLASCAPAADAFYDAPVLAAATAPGEVLRQRPFPGAPAGSAATRLLYASTTAEGTPVAVSALLIVPTAAAPAGGRRVLAWLHPTTGVARGCAPSLGPSPFAQIQGLPAFLAAGYAVVATDYAGLGGSGAHPYLAGISEAHAALDSVRAARRVPQAEAGRRFAVWGHSQGGHAALFTADLAAGYAPDLDLVGVAAAAPVTDVAALAEPAPANPLRGALLSYLAWSWPRTLGLDPAGLLPPSALPAVTRAAADCLETGEQLARLVADAAPLQDQPVMPTAPWRAAFAANAPRGGSGRVPVFLLQGDQDPVIPPHLTGDFAQRLCATGAPVRYAVFPGVDHYRIAMRGAAMVADWLAARFEGTAPASDCAALAGLRPTAAVGSRR